MFYDTVLFDLDDTLHDRNRSICNFIDLFIAKYSNLMECNSISSFKDIFIEIDCHGYKPREEMFTELLDRIAWKTKPEINELLDFWNSEFPHCAEPVPDLYEVLDFLLEKNIKMAIVTNGAST